MFYRNNNFNFIKKINITAYYCNLIEHKNVKR